MNQLVPSGIVVAHDVLPYFFRNDWEVRMYVGCVMHHDDGAQKFMYLCFARHFLA